LRAASRQSLQSRRPFNPETENISFSAPTVSNIYRATFDIYMLQLQITCCAKFF
jgi:hypothetical protein